MTCASPQTPVVSAVIIFFNGEPYLEEAIASVFAQTFTDWELLLADDGSTDGSTAVAQRWAAQHPDKVRYLEHAGHDNRGMSAARNLGIRHACGRYIAFLDSDDIWYPHKLAEQVAIMQAHPEVAMVYGPMELWYSWSGRPEDATRDFQQSLGHPPDSIVKPPNLLLGFLRDEFYIPSGILIRPEIIREVGGFEEEFRTSYEDVVFHCKVGLRHPIFASSHCWFRYRQHAESCDQIQKNTGTHRGQRRRYLEWLENYMQAHGFRDPVWTQLQRELFPYRHPRLHGARERIKAMIRGIKTCMKAILKILLPPSWQTRVATWWRSRRVASN